MVSQLSPHCFLLCGVALRHTKRNSVQLGTHFGDRVESIDYFSPDGQVVFGCQLQQSSSLLLDCRDGIEEVLHQRVEQWW